MPIPSVIAAPRDPRQNHLLAALSANVLQRWIPDLEWTPLPLGSVLYEADETSAHVHFPTTAIISLLYVTGSGASAEIAVVGNDGMVGVPLFMDGGSTSSRALVQSGGEGFRMAAEKFRKEFKRSSAVRQLLLRYAQALITQTAQTAVCNRHHTLDQQLCRWLLASLDRLQGVELIMTQKLIADMLGVRREGVTEAALKLQEAGLIHYMRGHITVLNRQELEKRSCECYAMVKKEYDRLLPFPKSAV